MGMIYRVCAGELVLYQGHVGIFVHDPLYEGGSEVAFVQVLLDGAVIRHEGFLRRDEISATPYTGEVTPEMWTAIRAMRVVNGCTLDESEKLGSKPTLRLYD